MIVVSLLLILVSGGLLATGILQANDPLVMASIGVSVLAAAALFLGIRQQRSDVERPVGQRDAVAPPTQARGAMVAPATGRVLPADAGRVTPAGIGNSAAERRPGAPPAVAAPTGVRPAVGSAAVGAAGVGSAPNAEKPGRTAERPASPPVLDQATTRIDRDAVEAGGVTRGTGGRDRPGRDDQPARPADDRVPDEAVEESDTEILTAGGDGPADRGTTEILDRSDAPPRRTDDAPAGASSAGPVAAGLAGAGAVDHEATTRLSPEDRAAATAASASAAKATKVDAESTDEPATAETDVEVDEVEGADVEVTQDVGAEPTETQVIDADPAMRPGPDDAKEPDDPDEPGELDDDEDPPDEPAAELLMASEVTRLTGLDHEVLVVDGRPRYHLSGCPHLDDKENQPLPISEAVELGFTACSLCGAATAVLAEAKQQ